MTRNRTPDAIAISYAVSIERNGTELPTRDVWFLRLVGIKRGRIFRRIYFLCKTLDTKTAITRAYTHKPSLAEELNNLVLI